MQGAGGGPEADTANSLDDGGPTPFFAVRGVGRSLACRSRSRPVQALGHCRGPLLAHVTADAGWPRDGSFSAAHGSNRGKNLMA